MSAAKHTPGPWALETLRTSCGICHKVGPFPGRRENDEPRHACLYADYPSKHNQADAELEANARLIAAAPDLLDALETIIQWNRDHAEAQYGDPNKCETWACVVKARAAIAKATTTTQ